MCNQFSTGLPGFPKKLESVRVNIGMPVVQTDAGNVQSINDYQTFWDG